VGSGIPASEKAFRRSAHLLQREQCIRPTGRMHENVSRNGRREQDRSTRALCIPATGVSTRSGRPRPAVIAASIRLKNVRFPSGNGFEASGPNATADAPR
jgi:hypothetical protein